MIKHDNHWNKATPQDIPPPTYWPAFLALCIALIFWGFLTVFFIGILGAAVFIASLAGWISELRNEISSNNKNKSS